MPYSQFTIDVISETFGFSISERIGIFTNVPAVDYSTILAQILKEYIPLAVAIGTEKARSEFIIRKLGLKPRPSRTALIGLPLGEGFVRPLSRESDRGKFPRSAFHINYRVQDGRVLSNPVDSNKVTRL